MQVCTSLETDNHASPRPLSFIQAGCPCCHPTNSLAGCPSCHPTNSVKALKANSIVEGKFYQLFAKQIKVTSQRGTSISVKQTKSVQSMEEQQAIDAFYKNSYTE